MDSTPKSNNKNNWLYKIFIGGIPIGTTEKQLYELFSVYGEILDLVIIKDKQSGRPRGFGFVTFKEEEPFNEVIEKEHMVLGKKLDLKKALPRDTNSQNEAAHHQQPLKKQRKKYSNNRKVFIGGLPKRLVLKEFTDYFQKYGEIEDIAIICDKKTREPRGFGFVTFADYSSVQGVLRDYSKHKFLDKWVECKVAFPKEGDSYSTRRKENKRKRSKKSKKERQEIDHSEENHEGQQSYFGHLHPYRTQVLPPSASTLPHSGKYYPPGPPSYVSYSSQENNNRSNGYYYPPRNQRNQMNHIPMEAQQREHNRFLQVVSHHSSRIPPLKAPYGSSYSTNVDTIPDNMSRRAPESLPSPSSRLGYDPAQYSFAGEEHPAVPSQHLRIPNNRINPHQHYLTSAQAPAPRFNQFEGPPTKQKQPFSQAIREVYQLRSKSMLEENGGQDAWQRKERLRMFKQSWSKNYDDPSF